ncbi:MAG: putative aminopeptidase [Bacteroidetes bacterium]|nr:putative aminopeptidase [Bacteroidota bacterium]
MSRLAPGLFTLLAIFCFTAHTQTTRDITVSDLQTHIKFLASEELEGRGTGTEGNRRAAEYIAGLMEKYGLHPAGDNGTYFQSFEFVSSVKLGSDNSLAFEGPEVPGGKLEFSVDEDYRPFGFSSSGEVAGPLVFAGYGISSPDNKYDDYKDLDVSGKIVVVLRFSPDGNDPHSPFNATSSFRNKARVARDKGAKGIIIIPGPADEPEDQIVKLSTDRSFESSGIVAISMKRAPFESMLTARNLSLRAIQDSIKSTRAPLSVDMGKTTVRLETEITQIKSRTANVLGRLEGENPQLKDQIIIVGAHMDHLGTGGPGSGSLQPDTVAVHHGADDNASGTAGLLELAEAFGARKPVEGRTILFISFTGEELGTLGSGYYVNHPVYPLERTVAMLNMDMIGRLDNRSLTVYGTGSSPVWSRMLSAYDSDSTFVLRTIPDGFGPSDQAEFYGKEMPVLHFFTGTHDDYHRPSDTWDKINYDGTQKIARYIYNIVSDLDTLAVRPVYVKTQSSAPMASGDSRGFSVTLGIIPDYGGEGSNGMKISGVRPKGPAERSGLKSGDIIVMMAGKKVMNIYDYMGLLGELKAGDQVEVEVMRDGKPLKVTATMDKRK